MGFPKGEPVRSIFVGDDPGEVEMARFDLTDFEWSVIQPLLPNKPRGRAAGG